MSIVKKLNSIAQTDARNGRSEAYKLSLMRAQSQVKGDYSSRFKQAADRAVIVNERNASPYEGKEEWDRGQFREGTPRDQLTGDASAMAMLRRAIGQGTTDDKRPRPNELGDDVRLNIGPSWSPGAISQQEYQRIMAARLNARFRGF